MTSGTTEKVSFEPTSVLFSAGLSHNKMAAIILTHPAPETRLFIRSMVGVNMTDEPAYIFRSRAGAFLQSDHPEYVLVEFWKDDFLPFIEFLNGHFVEWYTRIKENGLLEYLLERQANR